MPSEKSGSAPSMICEPVGVYYFRVEHLSDGRWEVSRYRDYCWRGAVVANSLEEAWVAACSGFPTSNEGAG